MVFLRPLRHRDQLCVTISGDLTAPVILAVRKFPDRRFSITHRCWYIIYEEKRLARLRAVLEALCPVTIEGSFDQRILPDVLLPVPEVVRMEVPREYVETLRRRRYSEATIVGYEIQFKKFLAFIAPRTYREIDSEMVHRYLLYLAEESVHIDPKPSHQFDQILSGAGPQWRAEGLLLRAT